ncbi:MAG: rRNA methyltransferase [Atribacterota bacterium]
MFGCGRFGFRGATLPWPYVGRDKGGFPRCAYPGLWEAPSWWYPISAGGELDFLRKRAEAIRQELSHIEERIRELEKGNQE